MSFRYVYEPRRPRFRFTRYEVGQILLAVGALTLAFLIVDVNPLYGSVPSLDWIAVRLFAALVAVITGFLFHEFAHKAMAVRYRCWAEFRADKRGLLIGIGSSLLGFVFAMPGAVYVDGNPGPVKEGKLSLAGPMTNLVLGSAGVLLAFASRGLGGAMTTDPGYIARLTFAQMAFVNLLLGAYNMIPLYPMDGSKVYRWDKRIYVGAFAGLIAVFAAGFLTGAFAI